MSNKITYLFYALKLYLYMILDPLLNIYKYSYIECLLLNNYSSNILYTLSTIKLSIFLLILDYIIVINEKEF